MERGRENGWSAKRGNRADSTTQERTLSTIVASRGCVDSVEERGASVPHDGPTQCQEPSQPAPGPASPRSRPRQDPYPLRPAGASPPPRHGTGRSFSSTSGCRGVCRASTRPYRRGTRSSFVSSFPGTRYRSRRVAGLPGGTCRTSRRADFPTGMGLAFVEMSPADRGRIRDHLAEHCRTARGRRFARRWPDGADEDESP